MRIAALCFLFIFPALATAQPLPMISAKPELVCKTHNFNRGIKVHTFTGTGYWLRSVDERYVTYTHWGGEHGRMLDLETGKSWYLGGIDPAPTPDAKFIVQPYPLTFYKKDTMTTLGRFTPSTFTDKVHKGFYQSVGQTEQSVRGATYRVLTGQRHGNVQDYRMNQSPGGSFSFTVVHNKPIAACNNMDRERISWETPIISPDGRMISTLNSDTGHTVVYSLEMPSGHCTQILDLKRQVNKVQFDPNNKNIAFVDQKGNGKNIYPTAEMASIPSGKSKTLSVPGEPVLYQGFRPDGKPMYTRGRPDDYAETDLVIVDPSIIPDPGTPAGKAAEALALVWKKRCFGDEVHFEEADHMAIGARMNDALCAALVQKANLDPELCEQRKLNAVESAKPPSTIR